MSILKTELNNKRRKAMILEIKNVKKCKNRAMGNFVIVGNERAVITISLTANKTISEYSSTLLHEMLHAWVTLLRAQGIKATNYKEHHFIYAVEQKILKEIKRLKYVEHKRRK